MKEKNSFCLVGDDHLLIKAASILLKQNHLICSVLSSNPTICDWVQQQGLHFAGDQKAFKDKIEHVGVDYLLSIANKQILPQSILEVPNCAAINYHNGLLPNYAGSNPNVWAILNNARYTGITWHIMTSTIDGGAILYQQKIPIEPSDTVASLNLKCHEHAASHFKPFIKQLVSNQCTLKAQSEHQRTYYPQTAIPPHGTWIDWRWSAEMIDRLLRALSFGAHVNTVALPKCQIGSTLFLIEQAQYASKKSNAQPGTLIAVSKNGIQVATSTGTILLKSLLTPEGESVSIESCIQEFHLTKGDRLPLADPKVFNFWQQFSTSIAQHEQFWVKRYSAEKPFQLHQYFNSDNTPYPTQPSAYSVQLNKKTVVAIKEALEISLDNEGILESLACLYLYKLHNYENFSVTLYQPLDSTIPSIIDPLIYHERIWNLALKDTQSIKSALHQLTQAYCHLRKRSPSLKDLFLRYPALKESKSSATNTIKIIFGEMNFSKKATFTGRNLFIEIDNQNSCYHIRMSSNAMSPQLAHCFLNTFSLITDFIELVAHSMEQSISTMPLLSEKMAQQFLYDWNNTKHEYDTDLTLITLFKKQVTAFPNKAAITFSKESMTYKELDEKSDQLAHQLLAANTVHSSSIIGVYMERDFILIISILAIAKLGATYLPLSPQHPQNYIETIVKESKPDCILANSSSDRTGLSTMNCRILCADLLLKSLSLVKGNPTDKETTPQAPAYLIYTSGSTGRPQGVLVSHKSTVNLALAQIQLFHITPKTRLLQFASINFDASISEIWTSLLGGATLYLAEQKELMPIAPIMNTLNSYQITCVTLPPAILAQLPVDQLPYLDTVISAGESCTKAIAAAWGEKKKLINAYGPTEATVCTTVMPCDNHHPASCIGRPINNVKVYVLDRYHHLVPIGITGELYVGGENLAIKYINNPSLTKQRFISSPFTTMKRLYKTGDQVCWLSDGTLDYKGRTDQQTKINGIRIELGMIESYLASYPLVRQSALRVYQNLQGQQRLAAYFVVQKNKKVTSSQLREFLTKHLPHAFIPDYWVPLDVMPLTLNGKINYKALPLPTQIAQTSSACAKKTCNPTEQAIATLWSEFLPCSTADVHRNFFELGGHSLIVLPVLAAVEKHFNQKINLAQFLETPTIAGLAKILLSDKSHYSTTQSFTELVKDSQFASIPYLSKGTKNKKARCFLLTGATGFLGFSLLKQFLTYSENDIYCLVRPNSIKQFRQKIALSYPKVALKRIKLIEGNLAEEKLGLSDNAYQFLGEQVNAICHAGAYVDHLQPYSQLKLTNVEGTRRLLTMAFDYGIDLFSHISSLTVINKMEKICEPVQNNEVIISSSSTASAPDDGYTQTKWVSERLLAQAYEQAMPIKIFRLGWIIGDKQTKLPCYNHLYSLIKGCIQLGCAPNWDTPMNLLPVDFVATLIAKASLNDQIKHHVFNLVNPYQPRWIDLIAWVNQQTNKQIECIPAERWLAQLQTIKPDNALYPFLPLYLINDAMRLKAPDLSCSIAHQNTDEAVAALGMHYPKIDYAWLLRNEQRESVLAHNL